MLNNEMTVVGKNPSSTQPSASHAKSEAFCKSGVVGLLQGGFPRLPEKDDAKELDHDVAGKRRGKREQRGTQRQQHVDKRVRYLVRE